MQRSYFCPYCKSEEGTFESKSETTILIRCQVCGYPVEEQLSEVSLAPTKSPGPLVLHIDDDRVLLRAVADMLTRGGFAPITAADGQTGLAVAKREKPTAVLLDVMMPDPDGYKVCRQLRAAPGFERVAIIMLTGSTEPKLDKNAFEAGADLVLRKPFEEQRLFSALRTAIQLKGIRRVR